MKQGFATPNDYFRYQISFRYLSVAKSCSLFPKASLFVDIVNSNHISIYLHYFNRNKIVIYNSKFDFFTITKCGGCFHLHLQYMESSNIQHLSLYLKRKRQEIEKYFKLEEFRDLKKLGMQESHFCAGVILR